MIFIWTVIPVDTLPVKRDVVNRTNVCAYLGVDDSPADTAGYLRGEVDSEWQLSLSERLADMQRLANWTACMNISKPVDIFTSRALGSSVLHLIK